MAEPDGVEAVAEPVAHAGIGDLDETGAGEESLGGEHAAGSAGEAESFVREQVALDETLRFEIAPIAPLFASESNGREELQARPGDACIGQQRAKRGERFRGGGDDFGDSQDGVKSDGCTACDGCHDAIKGAAAADGIVLLRVDSIERDAEVEAVGRGGGDHRESRGSRFVDEEAVREDAERSMAQDEGNEFFDVGVEEGLTTGEVELADSVRGGLFDRSMHLFTVHHRVAVVVRATGEDAVVAGEVAEGARDLKPEGFEVGEGEFGRRRQWVGQVARKVWQTAVSGEDWRQEASCASVIWELVGGG